MLNSLLNHTVFNISILWLANGQVYSTANHHRLLRQKAAKYHIRTQKYTKLHAQNNNFCTAVIVLCDQTSQIHELRDALQHVTIN